MLSFLNKYYKNIFSQNGEDGIIEEVLNRIETKLPSNVCVEFGGHDGYYCSNTRNLINHGWKGYMYDVAPLAKDVQEKMITPKNVNDLPECDLLSIDTDGEDYAIWKAYNSKPAIVIVEINSSFPPDVEHYDSRNGASYLTMLKLGVKKGYFLLCHCGNMVFVDIKFKKLFPEVQGDPIVNHQYYFNKSWLQIA